MKLNGIIMMLFIIMSYNPFTNNNENMELSMVGKRLVFAILGFGITYQPSDSQSHTSQGNLYHENYIYIHLTLPDLT